MENDLPIDKKFKLANDIKVAIDVILKENEKMKHNSIYKDDYLRNFKAKWNDILKKCK